jgi:MFS family permease
MAEVTAPPQGIVGNTRAALQETRSSLHSVFANPNLRRMQLALVGSMVGDWAYGTAVAVWAYGVGGATAVGVWTAIRMALLATTSPFTAALADRFPRKSVMIGTDLVRTVLVVAAAACLWAGTPPAPIFVLATVASLFGTPFRAAQGALSPALARTPDELTASNGASSTLESLAFFVGPAIGAGLLTVASVPTVFVVNAVTYAVSMLLVSRIVLPASTTDTLPVSEEAAGPAPVDSPEAGAGPGFLTETAAGFRAMWADKDLLLVIVQASVQTIIAGASVVFTVVFAVDLLETGPKGVGYLDSVLGVGAIVGGVYAISRSSRHKLAQDMTLGVVLWSLPLLLVTLWPSPTAAFAAVLVLGFANPLVDVNMYTIVQRITPDAVLGRVLGAMEACIVATMALGSALTPWLLHVVGLRSTLAILGLSVAAMALLGLPRMRALDQRLRPPDSLPLLQGVAMFSPLTPAVQESLARQLHRFEVPAGTVVLRLGDASDRFFIIESGQVEVTDASGAVLRHEGAGDFFGEIGLLRDVPRTANITAVEDTVLQALGRDDFLSAVTGVGESRAAAEDVVSRRLSL